MAVWPTAQPWAWARPYEEIKAGADADIAAAASAEARAQRRAAELGVDVATVLAEQAIRDKRDTGPEHSPLQEAPDAHTVDKTDLTLPEVVARIVALVPARPGPVRDPDKCP